MSLSESARFVEAASLEVGALVAETMRDAGAHDDRFGRDLVTRTARLAVTAWAMAAAGDDTTLATIAPPEAMRWLMHPVRKPWQVAPGPRVTEIEIWDLEASPRPPRLRLKFQFAGRAMAAVLRVPRHQVAIAHPDSIQPRATGESTLRARLARTPITDCRRSLGSARWRSGDRARRRPCRSRKCDCAWSYGCSRTCRSVRRRPARD